MKTTKKCKICGEDYVLYSSLTRCPKCLKNIPKNRATMALKSIIIPKTIKRSTKKKKRKINPLKPPTKKQLATKQRIMRNKCDVLWSKIVRLRAGLKCEYCGTTENLNAHHIFSRSSLATRWDLSNGCAVCSKHHVFSSEFSMHKTPIEAVEFLKESRGQDWYNKLRENNKKSFDLSEIESVYNFLKTEYDKFQ